MKNYRTDNLGRPIFVKSPIFIDAELPEVVAGQYALVSNGNQYIDTLLNTQTYYECDFEHYTKANTFPPVGLFNANGTIGNPYNAVRACLFYINNNGSNSYFGRAWGYNITGASIIADIDTYHLFTKTGLIMDIDGASPLTVNHDRVSNIGSYNLGLFATIEGNGDIDFYCSQSTTYVKIWSNSTRTVLARDMWAVPAGRTAQGASIPAPSNCMYDAVSDTYFENQGTGSFSLEAL